jgi:hypothetical protein
VVSLTMPARFCQTARMHRVFLAGLLMLAACIAPTRAEVNQARQRTLIDAAIGAFAAPSAPAASSASTGESGDPAAPGRVFFLGFAGSGEERVFAEEIKLAAREAGRRFGSLPRTLLLINDRRDLTSYPLATHDNLRYALRALSAVMDAERDLLFLALSSHGSQNGLIAVSNTGMPELGLGAGMLSRFLREAGIRWKVIVVSACFSGAFVEPLADDHTVVITAAARDRTSFGCSDERHLSYFGEAFYRDALPVAHSLRAAFEATRDLIHRREHTEKVTASLPQSFFGALIEARLPAFMRESTAGDP